jgi:hypothetical protein
MGIQVGSRSGDETSLLDCLSHLWRWSVQKNHWYCSRSLCFETTEKLSGDEGGNIDLRDQDTAEALRRE